MDFLQDDVYGFESHQNNEKCGLYVKLPNSPNSSVNQSVAMPLKHIGYDIEITNGLCSVGLEQTYRNPTKKFLEVQFSFPVDPSACVYKFVAEFGPKRIEGIVKEKEQAKREYKEAVRSGKKAAIGQIDEKSRDIMTLQIGNIDPESEVKVSIFYLHELKVEQNMFYRLSIPSKVSPRYMSIRDVRPRIVDPSKVSGGPYTWNFQISLETSEKVLFHKSNSHELEQISSKSKALKRVFKMSEKSTPYKQFEFLFSVENSHLPSYVLGRTDVSQTVMLSFIPKFNELDLDDAYKAAVQKKGLDTDMNSAKGEYIFLLDRSGSMSGQRIEKAKKALTIFLQSLPQNTYFNVVSFGNNSSNMFASSVKFDGPNLEKAVKEIEKMSANMGGTEIYYPLQKIYQTKQIKGSPKQIFLLTDGQVSNTNQIIELVQKSTKYSRCHSIGIGNGCSQALIKGCAEKGKGHSIFISDMENPSEKIISLLEASLTPVIDSVKLDYNREVVESVVPNPQSIPYILKDEVVNFYVTFKGQLSEPTQFTFGYEDSQNKVPFQKVIQINPESPSFPFVDKMAHFKVIKTLQEAYRNDQQLEEYMYYVKVKDFKEQAIRESIKHQLLSEFTAFLCVQKELIDGRYQQVKSEGQQKVYVEVRQPQPQLEQDCLGGGFDLLCSFGSSSAPPPPGLSALNQNMPAKFAMQAPSNHSQSLFLPPPIPQSIQLNNLIDSSITKQTKQASTNANQAVDLLDLDCAKYEEEDEDQESYGLFFDGDNQQSKGENLLDLNLPQEKEQERKPELESLDLFPHKNKAQERYTAEQAISPQQQQQSGFTFDDLSYRQEEQKQKQEQKKQQSEFLPIPKQMEIADLIKKQNSNGSFTDSQLVNRLFFYKASILNALIGTQFQGAETQAITYLAAKWIEKFHPSKEYSLIVKKAYAWIKLTHKLDLFKQLGSIVQ